MYRMTDLARGGVGMMCHASFRKALPQIHALERRTHASKIPSIPIALVRYQNVLQDDVHLPEARDAP
jgi:hypothetical protein